MNKPILIIDSKEPAQLKKLAIATKIPHEVKSLKVGDYAYVKDDEVLMLIERKKVADLLNAVISRRERVDGTIYHRYSYQLKAWFNHEIDKTPCVKVLGIVGEVDAKFENVFYGALGSSGIRVFDLVFWVKNNVEFLKTSYSFIKSFDEDKWRLPPQERRPGFDQIVWLQDVVGQQHATKLVKHFRTIEKVVNASVEELSAVIPKKSAKKLHMFFR
ncbi:MAG: hypothetical protein KKD77_24110 [Gammaproteobacteria bacterium]|nr:hypothetical protein [Gammaproteobacteria bacterium]MBU2249852.1 hypothetical protein [Gammaproteobacteria bacterium]